LLDNPKTIERLGLLSQPFSCSETTEQPVLGRREVVLEQWGPPYSDIISQTIMN